MKKMKKIKLSQLEMLVMAVDKGSFSAAGAEFGCTQSRISHGISELELCVNARLLIRLRSGCRPTLAGEAILSRARRILALADEIGRMEANASHAAGTVRVACVRSVGSHLLPHVMEVLSINYPDVNVEVNDGCHDYADVIALLDRGGADIGITREQQHPELISRPFVTDQYVAVVPADVQVGSPLRWEHLLQLPFIHVQQPGASWIVEQCRLAGVDLQPVRRTASESAALSLVKRGLGFSLLPRLTSFPKVSGVKEIDLPVPISRRLVVYSQSVQTQSTAVKVVIRSLLDRRNLEQSEAWRAGAIRLDV